MEGASTARLAWITQRCPDVADGGGFLYRRGQLLARLVDVPRVRAVARRRISKVEKLDVGGFALLRLAANTDPVELAEDIAHRYGEPIAAPNHVFRGEAAATTQCGDTEHPGGSEHPGASEQATYPGGLPDAPVTIPYVLPPVPARGRGRSPRVAVLDTGWVLHRWLWRIPANLDLDTAQAEDDLDLDALGAGGIAGHGTFTAGLVLRACPEARIVFRRVLDTAGICDEVQLARALSEVVRAPEGTPDVVLVPAGGYTWRDRPSVLFADVLAAIPAGVAVVAAAGNAGIDGRPFWPAAEENVVAVGALDADGGPAPFSNRGPWVDAAALGTDVESAFPHQSRGRLDGAHVADGYARWSGTSFAAAVVAGVVAARVNGKGQSGAEAARSMLAGAAFERRFGPTVRRVLAPAALEPPLASLPEPSPPPEPAPADSVEPEPPGRHRAPEPAPWPPAPAEQALTRDHPITVGFAQADLPDGTVPRRRALDPGTDYLFWFELGQAPPRDRDPVLVNVVLARFDGELVITQDAAVGEMELRSDGAVTVTRQPAAAQGPRRLYFPVRTPPSPGTYRLRCSMSHGESLLQSLLVEVRVGAPRWSMRPAVGFTVDYRAVGE